MFKKNSLLLMTVCLIMFMISTNSYSKQKSYSMVCKAGGSMLLSLVDVLIGGRDTKLTIRFKHASQAGTTREPAPGECAWMDRPLSANEPKLLFYLTKNPITALRISKGNVIIAGTSRKQYTKGSKTLVEAVNSGRKFFIKAKNKGDFLEISQVGL